MSTSSTSKKIPPSAPRHPEYEAHLKWLRGLSMKERGDLIKAKCRQAVIDARAREAAGLPPELEEPYPPSTMEWLRRMAKEFGKSSQHQETAGDDAH